MAWMAWTWQTALFFGTVGLGLALMTLAEIRWPTQSRRGFLPMATTRGDRFFISLLGSAFIHIAWLAATDLPVALASLLSLGYAALVMSKG
ncbi:MAG: hypothetical protein F4X81_00800 [Gammaproteobacteria bacterium]|nr:hypothetical protein [Gammaproteobacteria bacterium]MYE49986.1 hypothetical protein [Gammaproteobacteria bacterium]